MQSILAPGYYDTAAGTLSAIVTSLEMRGPVPSRPERNGAGWRLSGWLDPPVDEYRQLFRDIGQDWLWCSRLMLSDDLLAAIIHDPLVEVRRFTAPSGTGLLELDFRVSGECELAFLGLSKGLVGGGAGRWLMNRALEIAWARPLQRLWVHTCTLDHPGAIDFYRRSGFIPYQRQVEVMPDPRLNSILPETAAAHIPCIRG